jgi:hypothetical protein
VSAKTKSISRDEAEIRRQQAHDFFKAAELVTELADPELISNVGNVIGSLAVLSGVAASDAICGRVLGERSAADGHAEAVRLLKRATPHDNYSAQLRRLIDVKSEAQYSSNLITDARAAEFMVSARKLLEGVDKVFRERA